jgi:hypothetical protein
MTEHDLERGQTVRYLAKSTSKSAAIFRRYDGLALRNILYLSHRLSNLERPLDQDSLTKTLKDYCKYNGHTRRHHD